MWGPTKAYTVDFKDSCHAAMDCFEFFRPRVCSHGPAAESCTSHTTHT